MGLRCINKLVFSLFLISLWCGQCYGQTFSSTQTNGTETNNIITAVPFLLITPDARTAAMGEAGVAVSGDVNSSSNNPSKLAFLDKPYGFSLSYSPWLKSLVPDINLGYISGFYKLDDQNTIGASLRYFSLGQIQLTDASQQDLGIASPNEMAFDVTYARKFGNEFSLGSSLRYIYSNLTSGQVSAGVSNNGGHSIAIDISGLYKTETVLFGKNALISAGTNISNIGPKLSYSNGQVSYFLPTNFKLGGSTSLNIDDFNQFTVALDFNKLLVPTQPIYDLNNKIVSGKNPDRSVPAGIFGSFSDAPGGFGEEIREVGVSTGVEYWYSQQFALRAGYNYQSPRKGDSRYFTFGAGLKYNVFNIDFAYLIANAQTSQLANTLRFSLLFNFGQKSIDNK